MWTPRQKLVRLVWDTAGRLLWVLLPAGRPGLLRLFGGACGPGCVFARRVAIMIPWNLRCGARVRVSDGAILYALGPVTIGDDTVIDRDAHLCGGTHDMTDSRFPLAKTPITIGARCVIGADAYIGPDVVLGDDCRVWPRASVYRSFPDGSRLRGNPAKPVEPGEAPA
ncbi:MAG: putative colanic acid biosynthesis acetyltransferase [Phycisphaeraceae bacterium]|nr:MAG: putative colanic acid biosynthesis acetyltransferase [Phycisphaeraceae bacterium]